MIEDGKEHCGYCLGELTRSLNGRNVRHVETDVAFGKCAAALERARAHEISKTFFNPEIEKAIGGKR